jgi:hypothetical protein
MKCASCLIEAINNKTNFPEALNSLPQFPPPYLHHDCNRTLGAVDTEDPSHRIPCSSVCMAEVIK